MTKQQVHKPKQRKRGNGMGTIHLMANGRWRWQSSPIGADGKRVSRTFRTKTEAEAARAKGMTQHREGELSAPTKRTLAEQLGVWFDHHRPGWAANTAANYRRIIHVHLVPRIGHIKIHNLTAEDVLNGYKAIRDAKTSRGRSATLLRTARTAMKGSLDMAVQFGYLPRNPATGITLVTSRAVKRVTPHWNMEAAKTFLGGATDTPWGRVLLFTLLTGLRRGEVLGLRWQNVDLKGDKPNIYVTDNLTRADNVVVLTTLKSPASHRTLPMSGAALELLRELWKARMEAGSEFVFTSSAGSPLGPDNADRALKVLCTQLNLPLITPHGLRHTFVSVQRKFGVSIERISKHLGHKSVLVTLNIYSHIFEEDLEDLTLDLSAFLRISVA